MPCRNRVLPTGEIVANPARGDFMGNRGILHDDTGQLGTARWRSQGWVTCAPDFKNRKRRIMQPGHYTELFFLDEAVALAAGHRPCAQCRQADYLRFKEAAGVCGPIPAFDKRLHAARVCSRTRTQRRFEADIADLPVGTFILNEEGVPCLIDEGTIRAFTIDGYGTRTQALRSLGRVSVLTPVPTVAALRAGYRPAVRHPS